MPYPSRETAACEGYISTRDSNTGIGSFAAIFERLNCFHVAAAIWSTYPMSACLHGERNASSHMTVSLLSPGITPGDRAESLKQMGGTFDKGRGARWWIRCLPALTIFFALPSLQQRSYANHAAPYTSDWCSWPNRCSRPRLPPLERLHHHSSRPRPPPSSSHVTYPNRHSLRPQSSSL